MMILMDSSLHCSDPMSKILTITGPMGCGKSSVARELAALLCCSYTDLDDYIVLNEGLSIPEIFSSLGEDAFRKMEEKYLEKVLKTEEELVVALGGGTVLRKECRELIKGKSLCIYLRADAATLVGNLEGRTEGRPLLKTGKNLAARVEELLSQRSHIYEEVADIVIDTDNRTVAEIAGEILLEIKRRA